MTYMTAVVCLHRFCQSEYEQTNSMSLAMVRVCFLKDIPVFYGLDGHVNQTHGFVKCLITHKLLLVFF